MIWAFSDIQERCHWACRYVSPIKYDTGGAGRSNSEDHGSQAVFPRSQRCAGAPTELRKPVPRRLWPLLPGRRARIACLTPIRVALNDSIGSSQR